MSFRTAVPALLVLVACSQRGGDPRVFPDASPLGSGQRLREVIDPRSPTRPGKDAMVHVSGVVVTQTDTFDETRDGRSLGSVFLQDVGSTAPWSGIGTFGMTLVPANLRVQPGDVLDVRGQYQEGTSRGTAVFTPGHYLPQLFRPTAELRNDGAAVQATDIPFSDLKSFATGIQWNGMLVRVTDVRISSLVDERGRVSATLSSSTEDAGAPVTADTPTLVNELYDLKTDAFPRGQEFVSITGIVTYFFNLHLAPRSAEDLVPRPPPGG